MSKAIEGLKPELLWKYFAEISRIPRGSKNEEAVAKHVTDTAKKFGLEAKRDETGNVLVRKPATPGREKARSVCLQGHLDMVCEKNLDKVHDFMKDPIELVREGNILRANGTTLGADNGVAVAAGLALMEDRSVAHGPIEFLFTIDEETALTGATSLDPTLVSGKTLINLDSEEEGALYVGCSGGIDTKGTFEISAEDAQSGTVAVQVSVRGLRGGHSGLEIDKGRGNSLKILNRAVMLLADLGGRLSSFSGGNKHNAIPREADAIVAIPKKNLDAARAAFEKLAAVVRAENSVVDPDLALTLAEVKGRKKLKVIKKGQQRRLSRAIAAIPHGVIKMSPDIPGLVETSTNLAIVRTEKKSIQVITSQRSSVASEIADIAVGVKALFELADAEVVQDSGYPGWKPNMASPILEVAKASHRALFGKDPHVKAIHAGLECGLIGEKYPEMDMVSMGPTLEGVHSPDEKIYIDTVDRFWKLLVEILKNVN